MNSPATLWFLIVPLLFVGCADSANTQPPTSSVDGSTPVNPAVNGTESAANGRATPGQTTGRTTGGTSAASADQEFDFAPLVLSAAPGQSGASSSGTSEQSDADREQQIQEIIERLRPLQILLGKWRGTTRRDYDGFKAVDTHEWVWDLKSSPQQPALISSSDKSPHLRSARMSWDTSAKQFVLEATDADGALREFRGDFTDPVHEVVGSDDRLHQVFRLEFNQVSEDDEAPPTEQWQLAFAQQENNRYLLEVARRRGRADFRRFDTVSTQREGTSFARSDTDYAERTCIISEGLGTIELTYKGRSYWVCCTGCRAAFEEDPGTWIARASRRTEAGPEEN